MKNKITSITDGIKYILSEAEINFTDWKYIKASNDDFTDNLQLNKEVIPLLCWRYHEKFRGIKNIIGERLGEVSSLKSYSFYPSTKSLKSLIYQEIDLAEWWLDSKTDYLICYMNKGITANIIICMKNKKVATLELAVTLPSEAEPQYKHVVYSTHGSVSDRVVDTQIVQHAVYLYNNGKAPHAFTDIDYRLYGLSVSDVDAVYCAYALINGSENSSDFIMQDKRLKQLTKLCYESSCVEEKKFAKELSNETC